MSAKVNKNCDLLYKYLVHRIYGLPFKTPALVVEKDAVFIPAGWDNDKKIAILYENIQTCSPDDDFNEVITKPVHRKPMKDVEVAADDDQSFLTKMQNQLNQNIPATGGSPQVPSVRSSPAVNKPLDSRKSAGTTGSPLPGVPVSFLLAFISTFLLMPVPIIFVPEGWQCYSGRRRTAELLQQSLESKVWRRFAARLAGRRITA